MKSAITVYRVLCRKIYAFGQSHSLSIMLVVGLGLLVAGLSDASHAQGVGFNPERIEQAGIALLDLVEGAFGALIMIVAGLVAIIAAAMGAYRAAMAALVVAVGAFILRSMVSLFFGENFDPFGV